MAKAKTSKQIREARDIIADTMKANLTVIGENFISKVMKAYKNATDAQKPYAAKGLEASGFSAYKTEMLETLAFMADTALEDVKKEVPTKKKVKLNDWNEEAVALGEFDKLPKKIKKNVKDQVDLLMQTQKADLEKVVLYQFSSSAKSTDSFDTIEYDLIEKVEDFINGPSIIGGSSAVAGKVINETRSAYFFEEEVLDEIEGFEILNDVPESPICEFIINKVYDKDDPNLGRIEPPLHYNCDSYMVAILKGNLDGREIVPVEIPSSLEKYIQFSCGKNCTGRAHLVEIN